jgi:tetratricopeptide (TPR) repeat protein
VVQREEPTTLGLRKRTWWACRACGSVPVNVRDKYRYDVISKRYPHMTYLKEHVFYSLDEVEQVARERTEALSRQEQVADQRAAAVGDGFRETPVGGIEKPSPTDQADHLDQQVARNLRAIELEKAGRVDEAIELFEENVKDNFDGDLPYDRLGWIYRRRGLTHEEIRVLEKAIWVFENLVHEGRADRLPKLWRFRERLAKAKGDERPPAESWESKAYGGIYERRETSCYPRTARHALPGHDDSTNPCILKWWTPAHDQLLAAQIDRDHWVWADHITDRILAITPSQVIEAWKAEDPLCSQYSWYNVLMYFALSRAEHLDLTKAIRKPEWKPCPLCGNRFIEDSLPGPLVRRLGIDQLDFCAPCLKDAVLQPGDDSLSREDVLRYLRALTDAVQRVPSQGFGEGVDDLRGLTSEERLALLKLLQRKPSVRRVKDLFGSWFEALIEAGILEDDARRLSRGTQCLAKDGHICLSLGEKTIDDALHALGIPHEKEVRYPEGGFRADFGVNEVFIEYFGLTGDADYDAKTRAKRDICVAHHIKLISIYPNDLVAPEKLRSILVKGLRLRE